MNISKKIFLICLVCLLFEAKSVYSEPANSPSFEEVWSAGILGDGIGKSGIITADIDNDGVIEIVCGGSTPTSGPNRFWNIFEYSPVSQEYIMQWTSGPYGDVGLGGISSIAAFDVGSAGIYSVFIGLTNGDIHVYNGSTLEEVNFIDSAAQEINNIEFADADNDGVNEIIFCDDYNMFFYDPTSLVLKHQIPYGANDFEVGNVDDDNCYEIVLASGLVLEFNGLSPIIEWDYPGGDFGYLVELSDIDSDNMEEIIGASLWHYVTAFDADTQVLKWQILTDFRRVDALLLCDVDNDGIEDVLYGLYDNGLDDEIHCYDAVTLTQKWKIDNPEDGVTDIAVFDTDADGILEVVWGAGTSTSFADHLYVYGIPTLSFEWQSQHVDGPFHAIDVGDVDSDGQQEIVFASFESNSGYDDGVVFIYDAKTHDLEWQGIDVFRGRSCTGVHDLEIGDVDDDGVQEIVVATDYGYYGAIYIINGITRETEHSYTYHSGAAIYSLAIADVDNDGHTEIIAGGGMDHTGAPGVYVYVINGSTGEVEWHSDDLVDWTEVYAVEVGDVDNDGVPEIVALRDNIYVIDGVSHQLWQSTLGGYYGLDLHDTDQDGVKEIIVGTENGNIVAIDGQTLAEEFNINVCESSIVGLRAYDIYQDGSVEIIFASAGSLWVHSVENLFPLWQTEKFSFSAGDNNGLVISDIDSDGRTEVVIGSSHKVVELKQATCPDDLDCDGIPDDEDVCPNDANNDIDGDGVCGDVDGCPNDTNKIEPGECGCGVVDTDSDNDGVADCNDVCPGHDDSLDADIDGVPDGCDGCPNDPYKVEPGICGCGEADSDSDGDGTLDCNDGCPNSDLSQTVIIDGCDTGVENHLLDGSCTISDLIAKCAEGAMSHGKFASCVHKLTRDIKSDGIIAGREKGAIDSCADKADIP